MTERPFAFLNLDPRGGKPRTRGLTEIRGPHSTPVGRHYLQDLLEAYGTYVDSLKIAGGACALMPRQVLREYIELAHRHDVLVSTGGFLERVLLQGSAAVDQYIRECRELGFDILEISAGFISLATEDWLRLIEKVRATGMRAKPELGIRFGAGGGTADEELEADGARDPDWVIGQARRFLDAGADLIMIESDGIAENGREQPKVVARLIDELGTEKLMFAAADPEVFAWYLEHCGAEVNLSVDHSQIVRLEALRSGLWGPRSLWGRALS